MDAVESMKSQLHVRRSIFREIEMKLMALQAEIGLLKRKDEECEHKFNQYIDRIRLYVHEHEQMRVPNENLHNYLGIGKRSTGSGYNRLTTRIRRMQEYEIQLTKIKAKKRLLKQLMLAEIDGILSRSEERTTEDNQQLMIRNETTPEAEEVVETKKNK